ncbi:MAG TPA: tyrosine-type recombinase/integrase [Chloroflexia bacterium]|nr:tyrosine-type recombinase/integrase [Chloroflexia bacterium]
MDNEIIPLEIEKSEKPVTALSVESLSAENNPVLVYLARLSGTGRVTMRSALDKIAQLYLNNPEASALQLPWHLLRYQHTAALRARLKESYKPATANKMLSAMRGVLKEAWRLGLMEAEEYHRAVAVESVKGKTLPRGRALKAAEIGALLQTCAADPTPAGARDAAIIAIMYSAGLRRAELAGLTLANISLESGEVRVIAGKGHKDRLVYLVGGALVALRDWLKVRGTAPGPLFYRLDKTGQCHPKGVSDEAIMRALVKRAKQAGLENCSPHDMRRTFISDLLDSGADISTVQRLAGHSDISTTARYDRRGEETKKKATELLNIPYPGKAGPG